MKTVIKKFSTIDEMNDEIEAMVDAGTEYRIRDTRHVGDELEVTIEIFENDGDEDLSACCSAGIVNGLCSSCHEHA